MSNVLPFNGDDYPGLVPTDEEMRAGGGGGGGDQVQTMSSKEIAELTGKDHADVLKDIRRILEQAEIDAGRFSGIYLDARNRQKPCYHLPKRECDLVVSGYSVKYRWAIIQRWHELEEAEKAPVHYIPQTHREAILAYAELSDGLQFCH